MALDDFISDLIKCRTQGLTDEETAEALDCSIKILPGYEASLTCLADNKQYLSDLDVSPETKEQITSHYSTKKIYLSREQRVQEIRELAPIAYNVPELAEAVGLSESTVRIYAYQEEINLPTPASREQRVQEIRELAPIAYNVPELAEAVGLAEQTVRNYASQHEDIDLPHVYDGPIRRPEIDDLIVEGCTLQQIKDTIGSLDGKRTHLSRERIRRYINGTGQHADWVMFKKLRAA